MVASVNKFKERFMESVDTRIWKELLSIFNEEELIRFHRRLRIAGKNWLAKLLEIEINKRGR